MDLFKQPILLSPAVLIGGLVEGIGERLSLSGKFDLAKSIPVDYGGKHLDLNAATYNVQCELDRMGRPTDVKQELSLYVDNPKEHGHPNLKITLSSGPEDSKFDAEYAPEGATRIRILPGEMSQQSIVSAQSMMLDMAKAIAGSLTLTDKKQWSAGQDVKVTGMLSAKGTNLIRFLPELKDELKYLELADVQLRKNK
jgi:hypothetical protein